MELRRQEAQASSSDRSCDHGGGGGGGGGGSGGGDRAGFDRSIELGSVDRCGSGTVGAPIEVAGGSGAAVVEVAKRKRGRPPRGGYVKAAAAAAVVPSAEEEEDVCFICFDGGSLVLCDRRNCPKAYHPACIKRDEAFFKSRAKWNCGWHICSICMKASHYLCYTCTYSLCKGCTKDADYVCVRGNKGFCGTCKRTILLIENFEGNKEVPQVDFDDKTSWEYLFKVYWVLLKGNLSLTLDDLLKATNPWKPPLSASKWGFAGGLYGGIGDNSSVSASHCPDPEVFNAKRRKINTKTNVLITKNSLGIQKDGDDTITHGHGATSWASKELLEFVAHMRNGDTSLMSEFDVQDLLLEYIKKNNLRDPHQKCQIVCDSIFLNMFGQARLDQIEMLKLLQSHFLVQDDYLENDSIVSGIGDAVGSQMESGRCYESQMTQTTTVNDKRRKVSKSSEEKGQQINPNEYARIDVNNIKLIYLRRKLLENLLDGADKFNEKVVGSIVRIRVSTSDQKPDMHRLVRVVGTSADAVPYKIGSRETSVMLEILNLDKREVLALDKISNEEFSQDECERLRQSIKFGLIKRLTVGEIQEKARVLHEVILHDWLEAEISRLNNLRDQAIEKGHLKELREYVEKLQNLNAPEERKRLLEEVPVVQSDPTMDPSYDFDHSSGELDRKKLDNNKVKTRNSGVGRKKRESISPGMEGEISSNSVSYRKYKTSAEKRREDKAAGVNCLNASNNEADHTDSGTQQPVNDWEMHKIWHYQDPTGKIQGPFFMLQLRKWSISGHFPPHLRVWRLNEKPEDSILLTDALDGLCSKEQLLPISCPLLLQEQEDNTASDSRNNNADDSDQNKSSEIGPVNGERVEQSVDIELIDHGESNVPVGNDGLGSNPTSSNTTNVANSSDGNSVNNSEGLDSLNGNHVLPSTTLQVSNSVSTPVFPENQMLSLQIGEDLATERNSDHSENVGQNAGSEIGNNQVSENHSDGEDQSGQSSGQNWRPPLSSSPTNNQDSNSVAKSLETSEQNKAGIDFPTSNTTLPSVERSEENKQPVVSSIVLPVQDAGPSWSTASSLVGGSALMHEVAGESGGYSSGPAKPSSMDEWESSLASASSLKPREIPGDNVPTPASISDHLTPSSPSHPHSNTSSWQDMLPDTDEFSSLLNESVSDLLAEVEAMESLHALSCHNVVNSGGDLTQGSKTDCISPVEGFSPAPEHGKGDAFSSTVDINLPLQSNVIDEPLVVVSDPDVLNSKKSSKAHQTSTSSEADRDTRNSEVSVNQWEASGQPLAVPTTTSWSIEIPDPTWNSRSDSMNTTWNANMNWESGLDQGNDVMDWNRTASRLNIPHTSLGITPPAPSPMGGILGSQPRHGGDRYSPRDRGYHSSRDSPGFGRNRHGWNNRQQYFGSVGGGGSNNGSSSFRAPVKGQRVCKFYESGYCKRGSSCTFFHP